VVLPVILAAAAFAGAPAGLPFVCNPAIEAGSFSEPGYAPTTAALEGITYFHGDQPGGPLTPRLVLLGHVACAGALLAGASPSERTEIQTLNPSLNEPAMISDGLLVILHESSHAALRSVDETAVECRAMSLLPAFLAHYLGGADYTAGLGAADAYDAGLPSAYHAHPC
jgi:hypothetical protein